MAHPVEQAREAVKQKNWSLLQQSLRQWLGAEFPEGTPAVEPDQSGLDSDPEGRSLQWVVQLLTTGDFSRRWQVAKLLPAFGVRAIAPLRAILEDPETDLEGRWFAARILGEFQHPTAIQGLVELLQTSESAELRGVAAAALAEQGTGAIAALVPLLADPSTRLLAVQALAQIPSPEVIEPLLQVVQDQEIPVRLTAIAALTPFPDPRILAVLVQSLTDPAAAVRREAVIGLGLAAKRLPQPEALVPDLIPRLRDADLAVGQQAAIALGRLQTDAATAALFQVLMAATTPVPLQLASIRALGWIGTPQALECLGQGLQLPSPEICYEIITVLGRFQEASQQAGAAQILIELLKSPQLATHPPRIKQALTLSLGHLGQPQALEPLLQCLADPDLGIKLHSIRALQQLDATTAYQRLQVLAHLPHLPPELQQGVAIALQEWTATPGPD